MKPYSVDLREKVVSTYHRGNISLRKLAANFGVGKAFVQKMLKQHQQQGHVNLGKQGGGKKAVLADYSSQLIELVEKYPDATLAEYCEYWQESHEHIISQSMMCRALQKLELTRKKKTVRSSQAATDRVQLLRCEYWDKVRDIEPKNMVFLDETGILLTCRVTRHDGLMRHHARSKKGSRVYDLKRFYRGKKVTVIGAISMDKVLAVMTMDNSMDSNAFHVFVEKFLVPQLWIGAVVIMDNLSVHTISEITPLIKAVGAHVINLSPYSPDFNPIEHWWSQLGSPVLMVISLAY